MARRAVEVQLSQPFEFGENWRRFLSVLNDKRITEAEKSLCAMLEVENLSGKTFLDIGSGSGLFSLAAMRLAATKVHSFDYDPQSVVCTQELKRRYCPNADCWTIEEGSVLDAAYLGGLGQFDIVYSWGVLHHTGNMWQALENVVPLVARDGRLFIAVYNDQGMASRCWRAIKRAYNLLPQGLKFLVLWPSFIRLWGPTTARDLLRLKPFRTWRSYYATRGMSPQRDVTDWVGGYPFEVATPEEIFDFYRKRGFTLVRLKTCGGGHGNNEFVFQNRAE